MGGSESRHVGSCCLPACLPASAQTLCWPVARSLGSEEAARKVFLDRQPSGRLGRAEDIAGICAFLASDDAAFMTGQAVNVDGGVTI